MVKELKKLVEVFYGEKLDHNLPLFFIDSDSEEPDEDSLEERQRILNWAKSLAPFNIKDLVATIASTKGK